jgi:hypothetical protein
MTTTVTTTQKSAFPGEWREVVASRLWEQKVLSLLCDGFSIFSLSLSLYNGLLCSSLKKTKTSDQKN